MVWQEHLETFQDLIIPATVIGTFSPCVGHDFTHPLIHVRQFTIYMSAALHILHLHWSHLHLRVSVPVL
ncbi:hypothetical protein JZ751_012505 [Albula glossodonta]|uniref:Uncharacterized protein n=1 Tax=Albula glossodonta TaxID=121402 RepID=A0A8T2NV15_9TELE|nr:hypothetical protein JZ751_012505 [Albula glossodonta]